MCLHNLITPSVLDKFFLLSTISTSEGIWLKRYNSKMSLGHFEKETVTHKNENTLLVYRHKSVHF